jgi:hypothetical protein
MPWEAGGWAGEAGELLLGYGRGGRSRQSIPPFSLNPNQLLITFHHLLILIIMTERPRCTPPPPPSTQPPWMLTPPRSAEKLMRALSIDPFTSNDEARTSMVSDYDNGPEYLTYLQEITSPTYRDPPLPLAPPRQEPLFLDDEDDDDIQMGTDNRMVSPT